MLNHLLRSTWPSRSRGAKRMRVGTGIVGAACALERQLPRAKLRTEARRGIRRAPTFTASIRPVLTSRLTVLSLTSPSSACVALIEINSGSCAKRLACLSFTGFTSRNDLLVSRLPSDRQATPGGPDVKSILEDAQDAPCTSCTCSGCPRGHLCITRDVPWTSS